MTKPMVEQPAQSGLKALIEDEHHRAEQERLLAGYEGCGCASCQEFYKTINLSVYGDRVKRYADIIVILAGKTGATKWDQYHPEEKWQGEVFIISKTGYTLTPELQTISMPVTDIPKELLQEEAQNDGSDRQPGKQRSYKPGSRRSRGKRGRFMLDTRRRSPRTRRAKNQ